MSGLQKNDGGVHRQCKRKRTGGTTEKDVVTTTKAGTQVCMSGRRSECNVVLTRCSGSKSESERARGYDNNIVF